MTKSEAPILAEDAYKGILTFGGASATITFRLSAGPDCRLVFDIDPIDVKTYFLIADDSGCPGQTVTELSLTGRSEDGKTIKSDCVSVVSFGSNENGHYIRVTSRVATVTHPLKKAIERPLLRLWFRSF